MRPHDYFMPLARRIEDGFLDNVQHRSFGETYALADYILKNDDGNSVPATNGYPGHRPHSYDPDPGPPETFGPAYRPYEPGLPTPVCPDVFVPPPPLPVEPEPQAVEYDDCRMTQAFFDWSISNATDPSPLRDGLLRPDEQVRPVPPLETLIETFLPATPPADDVW